MLQLGVMENKYNVESDTLGFNTSSTSFPSLDELFSCFLRDFWERLMWAEQWTFFPFENIHLKRREHKTTGIKIVFKVELYTIIFLIFSYVVFWKIKIKLKWSLANFFLYKQFLVWSVLSVTLVNFFV